MSHRSRVFDVAVVGAGITGACAAYLAGRAGHKTLLIDPREWCPPVFKAEKVEQDQADLLRRLRLFEVVRPALTPIPTVLCAKGVEYFGIEQSEQYGVEYQDLVNAVLRQLPNRVERALEIVQRIEPTGAGSTLHLKSGEKILAPLVIVATGTSARLLNQIGVEREWVDKNHSMAFGFDMEPGGRHPFFFDSLTYYPNDRLRRIACATLFPVHEAMRVNLFVYRGASDPWVRAFLNAPLEMMRHELPGLERVAGPYKIGPVTPAAIRLYRSNPPERDGLVLLGDACQAPCPTTGTGLSKVLNDLAVFFQETMAGWTSEEDFDSRRVAQFYKNPKKVSLDRSTLDAAVYGRKLGTQPQWTWSLRATMAYFRRKWKQRTELRTFLQTRPAPQYVPADESVPSNRDA